MASTTPFYNQWLMSIVISGIGSLPMQVRARGNKAPYICLGGSTACNVQTNAPVSYQVIGPYACQQAAFLVCSQHVQNGATIPVGSPPGAGQVLAEMLCGRQFPINACAPPPN